MITHKTVNKILPKTIIKRDQSLEIIPEKSKKKKNKNKNKYLVLKKIKFSIESRNETSKEVKKSVTRNSGSSIETQVRMKQKENNTINNSEINPRESLNNKTNPILLSTMRLNKFKSQANLNTSTSINNNFNNNNLHKTTTSKTTVKTNKMVNKSNSPKNSSSNNISNNNTNYNNNLHNFTKNSNKSTKNKPYNNDITLPAIFINSGPKIVENTPKMRSFTSTSLIKEDTRKINNINSIESVVFPFNKNGLNIKNSININNSFKLSLNLENLNDLPLKENLNDVPLKENLINDKIIEGLKVEENNIEEEEVKRDTPTNKLMKTTTIKFRTSPRKNNFDNPNKEREEYIDRYNSYIIIPGNSSYLIKNCMAHRSNWRECQSNVTTLFNFKWQQNNIGIDFVNLSRMATVKQIVNHFEFHPVISNKCNLFINLTKYCENKGLEVFKYIPFSIIVQYESSNYITQMDNFSKLYYNIQDYIGCINESEITNQNKIIKYSTMFSFLNNDKLGNKTNALMPTGYYNNKNFWIVKACDLNRGICIKLANSFQKVQKLVKIFYEGISKAYTNEDEELKPNDNLKENSNEEDKKKLEKNKYRTNSVIIQKYLERPLLYRTRKFDIRIWVLLSHNNLVYVFKEGHLKTSSVPYDINQTNNFVHITNYSIQKYNTNFSKFEQGNEVSFEDFQFYLNEEFGYDKINIKNDIMSKINEIIEITFRAVDTKINSNSRKSSFEIFGYDFILDEYFNVYLIEANTNPGLEESSPLIKMLVPRMLDDALRLTIDDSYDTKYSFFNNEPISASDKNCIYYSPFYVKNYSDSENLWQLVCDLNEKDPRENVKNSSKKRKKLF